MSLGSRDTQLILVGLVLTADDEGIELEHPKILIIKLNYPPEQIETALQELAANDLLILYQVGKHRYFSLTRWGQWQTLSSNKITLSKYPAPPVPGDADISGTSQDQPEIPTEGGELPTEPLGNSGKVGKTPAQFNISESNVGEVNRSVEPPDNVTPFPTALTDNTNGDVHAQIGTTAKEVAMILKLPICHALTRLVTAYMQDTAISLLVEADAAREWIDDRQRNQTGKTMTVNFFRNWLKRERQELQERQTHQAQATGTDGSPGHEERDSRSSRGTSVPRGKSLMGLEAQYREAYTQKEEQ